MKLIGLITTVVILGAVYLFMVKPVLDTTNNAFDSVDDFQDEISTAFEDADINGVDIDQITEDNAAQIKQQLQEAGFSSKKAQKLADCITDAGSDTGKIQACAEKFG